MLISTINSADIKTANFDVISSEMLKKSNDKTIVVFDIDYVLVEPKDKILKYENIEEYFSLCDDIFKDCEYSSIINAFGNKILQEKNKCVDERFIELIKKLQKKCDVICLTDTIVGKFGNIESVPEYRVSQLKTLGYTFHSPYEKYEMDHTFKFQGNVEIRTEFKNGIIFSNRVPKGLVLKKYLEKFGKEYSSIIFIDDREKNIKSVKEVLNKKLLKEINLTTIQYIKIDECKNELTKEEIEIGKFQLKHLRDRSIWLSDYDAKEKIKVKKQKEKLNEIRRKKRLAVKNLKLEIKEKKYRGIK